VSKIVQDNRPAENSSEVLSGSVGGLWLRLRIVGWDRKDSRPSGCTKEVGGRVGRPSSERGGGEFNREFNREFNGDFGAEDRLDSLILMVLVMNLIILITLLMIFRQKLVISMTLDKRKESKGL